MSASYEHGCDLIAVDARAAHLGEHGLQFDRCVMLLAELFDVTPDRVAHDVMASRERAKQPA